MTNRIKINGVEYPSVPAGCSATGINYGYVRIKAMKADKFEIKQIAKVEIIREKTDEKCNGK